MISLSITTLREGAYDEVSRFARETYDEKLGAAIPAKPHVFAYGYDDARIVGCFGLYLASKQDPLLIETYVERAFETISGDSLVDRRMCGELGTRAVNAPEGARSGDISIGLAATLLMFAHDTGIRYLGFTSNRTVRAIADALGVSLVDLGEPDLSEKDGEFRKNWKEFFRVKQLCFGLYMESNNGCHEALQRLSHRGIYVHQRHAAAA